MTDNTNEVNLSFKTSGINDVKNASDAVANYRDQLKGAKQEEDNLANGGDKLKTNLSDIDDFFKDIDFTSEFKALRSEIQGATDDADKISSSI
jgi:hypothetical protein